MKMHIPHLRDKIQLTEDWTFDLYYEHRNVKFMENCLQKDAATIRTEWESEHSPGPEPARDDWKAWTWWRNYGKAITKVTIPAGRVLSIARIYIRNGAEDFDSVTFTIKPLNKKDRIHGRFWAKLRDVNQMVFEPVQDIEAVMHGKIKLDFASVFEEVASGIFKYTKKEGIFAYSRSDAERDGVNLVGVSEELLAELKAEPNAS